MSRELAEVRSFVVLEMDEDPTLPANSIYLGHLGVGFGRRVCCVVVGIWHC